MLDQAGTHKVGVSSRRARTKLEAEISRLARDSLRAGELLDVCELVPSIFKMPAEIICSTR